MRFQGIITIIEIKRLEAKATGKPYGIIKGEEPHSYKANVMGAPEFLIRGTLLDQVADVPAGSRAFVMGTVESDLNDKGYVRTTLSIDRIEVLAGPAGKLTLDAPATARPTSFPRSAAPATQAPASSPAPAATDDDPLPF